MEQQYFKDQRNEEYLERRLRKAVNVLRRTGEGITESMKVKILVMKLRITEPHSEDESKIAPQYNFLLLLWKNKIILGDISKTVIT